MDALVDLTFREPRWLWTLLALLPLLGVLLWREQVRMRESARFVSEHLRGRMNTIRRLRPWLLTAEIALASVSLAGPQLGVIEEEIRISGSSRIFVIDVSESMTATDAGGSRLHAARAIVRTLLERAPERVALIVFEATPLVMTPLTGDAAAVTTLLDSLGVAETERAGSDLGAALLGALDLAVRASPDPVDIVIVSDGEHQGPPPDAAIARAEAAGIPVHTILVGTAQGGPMPTGGGMKQGRDGNSIITRASDEPLRTIAAETGGRFLDNPFVGDTLAATLTPEGKGRVRGTAIIRTPVQRYQLPLTLAIVLLLGAGIINRGVE